MSGIINKVKEKVAEMKADSNTSGSTNTGMTQTSGTGMGAHNTTTGSGVHGTSGIGSSGANTTAGPHNSDMLNKADPRVDSDLSGGHPGSNAAYTSAGTTGTTGGYGSTGVSGYDNTSNIGSTVTTGYNTTGTTGTSGFSSGSTNAGPHSSNLANKLDPRVDSDLDGGRNAGMNQTTGGYGTTGTSSGFSGSTNAGPHNSNLANRADPRVDSDLDGSNNAGLNQTTHSAHHHGHHGHHHGHNHGHTGQTGTAFGTDNSAMGTTGTGYNTNEPVHNNQTLNKLDPRVTTSNTTTTTGTTGGQYDTTGASTGPVHNNNLLNKLDPRVDSNAAPTGNTGSSTRNEPLDASKHGPSAFREVHGDPTIHHDYPDQASAGRHGSIGRSDQHYGSGAH